MNEAQTEAVELNVLAEEPPAVPASYRDCEFVFWPIQRGIADEVARSTGLADLVAADTMNHWIVTAKDELLELLERVDMLIVNEGEARLLTGRQNLMTAAQQILELGPRVVVIKKGEYGAMLHDANGDTFLLPAYPTPIVIDPTGAGDSFAGGLMGYLAQSGNVDLTTLRNAMVYGTVAASFTIGDFSIHGIRSATREMIEERYDRLRKVTQF